MPEICDFCLSPDVRWSFPCRDFKIPTPDTDIISVNGWAACETCYAFVEAGDRTGLYHHSVAGMRAHHPNDSRAGIAIGAGLAQGGFWANRLGPGEPNP